jgi:2-haloacid dehalogenase
MAVRGLVFDVFGTLVDWRSGIADAFRASAVPGDPEELADAWRARYRPILAEVNDGARPWGDFDELHLATLDALLADRGVDASGDERHRLVDAWHRLDPWPDVLPGLRRLSRSYVLAPLSNGNVALQVDLARRSGLPWDCVLGAEVVRHYKPDPEVYDSAPQLLAVPSSSVVMVAAHLDDLAAARARGLRTAYVHRPDEFGGLRVPPSADPDADLSVASFEELASALGA